MKQKMDAVTYLRQKAQEAKQKHGPITVFIEGFVDKRSFKTLRWDEPSYTVSYGNREVHIHPSGKRRLSAFEAMQLQGFPKDFVLNGTFSDQISQISEAVPPPLAKAVAVTIKKAIYEVQTSVEFS